MKHLLKRSIYALTRGHLQHSLRLVNTNILQKNIGAPPVLPGHVQEYSSSSLLKLQNDHISCSITSPRSHGNSISLLRNVFPFVTSNILSRRNPYQQLQERCNYSILLNPVTENRITTIGSRCAGTVGGKIKDTNIANVQEKSAILHGKKKILKKKRILTDSEVVSGSSTNDESDSSFTTAHPPPLLQHNFLTFEPGLELPHMTTPKKRKPDWEVMAYAAADEYNLEGLLKGFEELGLYERSSHHLPSIHNPTHKRNELLQQSSEDSSRSAAAESQERAAVEGFAPTTADTQQQQLDVIPSLSDVLHVVGKYKVSSEEREIYFFRDGAVVFWNVAQLERSNVLGFLEKFSIGDKLDKDVVDEQSESFPYSYTVGKTLLSDDRILLGEEGPLHLERYTFSNALAVSVKLGIWEAQMDEYVDNIKNVSRELRKSGNVILSHKEVLQRLGQLYELRHSLTLSSDLLDTPDYYWDRQALTQLYEGTSRNLCIAKRTDVMSVKLNHCLELVELLNGHHGEQQGHRLELIIIWLILVEVVFGMLHFVL